MKNITFLFFLTVVIQIYSYTLENKWLQPGSITVYQTDTLYNHVFTGRDSLANFNFQACIDSMNTNLVDSMPVLSAGGINNSADCLVRYAHCYDIFGQFDENIYGICASFEPGEFTQFKITLNDSAYAPWATTSPSTTDMDINTTLRHEIGHALGIFHSQYSTSLMFEDSSHTFTNQIKYIANDEINALRNVYTPPVFNNVTSTSSQFSVNPGDTIMVFTKDTLTVDLKLPEMLIFESVTPPALKPIAFMNSASMTDTLVYTTIGTGIYRFKIPTDNLNLSSINLLRTFVRRSSMNNDLSNYINQNSPISKLYIDVSTRQCRVDLPLPATESWFDFETRLNFAGSILAEPEFADSLDNVLIGFDVFDDYASELNGFPVSIFHPQYFDFYYCDSTAYFCEFTKDKKQITSKPEKSIIFKGNETINTMQFNDIPNIGTNDKNTKELTVYPAFTARYPRSLDIYPGTYTVFMMAIRKDLYEADETISEIAKSDSMQFIIPMWKLKLHRDYWITEKVPYAQIKEYELLKPMDMLIWRPVSWGPHNLLSLDIIRETDSTIVKDFTIDFNAKAAYDYAEWIPDETTEPGFYNLKANLIDYDTGIEVKQEILTQVCPLYLSWENSGDWPDNWPNGEDSEYWKIHTPIYTPATGSYCLSANYTENLGSSESAIERQNLSMDSEWDRVLEFAIGLPKNTGVSDFEELLADYSIATSKDGANWTIEKTPQVTEYNIHEWEEGIRHCYIKSFKPLGKITDLGIKFIMKGHSAQEPDSQVVLFDEVKIDFTKEPVKPAPSNPETNYAGGNVSAGWGSVSKGTTAFDEYYIYRNGIKIGTTTETSFVDSTVEADRFYNYSITAHYNDGSVYPESPMLECSKSIYTGLYSPSNLVITNENPNIKLEWDAVDDATAYEVYSSADPYSTFEVDTTGTFNGLEWVAPLDLDKLFYYVIAVNENKKDKKIIKTSGNQVK